MNDQPTPIVMPPTLRGPEIKTLDHARAVVTKQAPEILAEAYYRQRAEILELKRLIVHAWVHTAYPDCGRRQMTTEQKHLYDSIIEDAKADRI